MDVKGDTRSEAIHHEINIADDNVGHEVEPKAPILSEFSVQEQRKILRRIDLRILPIVGAVYCISLIDRTNLGAANIAGMAKDLELTTGMRYSTVTLVFFPTYIVFELPATVLIRWIGPRLFLSSITMTWAAIMIGFGFTNNWKVLGGLRAVLGILEAGFFPGCLYFLSTWYTRYEMHKRYAVWYFCGSVIGALGGILAYGLMQMDGICGLAGWRWIFIMEGVITAAISIAAALVLVGFPDSKKLYRGFLNAKERDFVVAKINADRGDAEEKEPFNMGSFLRHGLDIKVWGFALLFCMLLVVSYSFAYFLPIILQKGMGFSTAAAQCLVTPPYVAAGIMMYTEGWLGDKYKTRAPILLFNCVVTLIGLPVMAFSPSMAGKYVGAFLTVMGANSNIPCTMAYQANNIRGHWKRCFCSATFVGFGGIGGIIGSLVFRSQDAPRYLPGIYACIVSQVLVLAIVLLLSVKFRRDNKNQAAGTLIIERDDQFRYTI
ncbi:High-affinity nicotinic acid transporter [Exophiala dermatitidis]